MRAFSENIFIRFSLFTLIFVLFMVTPFGSAAESNAAGNTYYVSPDGNDGNPGTEAAPWKTLQKAAATLQAGDTAVFEDGVYESNQSVTFGHNGAVGSPITIKARNKQQAKLLFDGLNTTSKITLQNKNYISILDFEITQVVSGTASADVFINIINCSNCVISGNAMHGAGGKAVQGLHGEHIEVIDNEVYDIGHIGIVLANINRPIIANNEIREINTVGIMVPAGTRSAQIYNNAIHAVNKTMTSAITLGGSYPASVAYDPDGFESYHAAAWNNVIVSEQPGLIGSAFTFRGSTDSGFYHNIVIDAKHAVSYGNGGSSSAGWLPETTNPKFYNNIISGCTVQAIQTLADPVNASHDHNLYHNCAGAPQEANGVNGDPQFINRYDDWNLEETSPALGGGIQLDVKGFYNETISVPVDIEGALRTDPVHMGIYSYAPPLELEEVLFTEDFENGADAWTSESGILEIVEETPGGNHVFTDPSASSSSGVNRMFAGSMDWESYEFKTRVKFDEFYQPNSWLTFYARYTDIRNYYLVEIQGDRGYIALKEKFNGVVTPIQEKFNWYPPMGEWVDIRIVLNGPDLEVYINDKLELIGSGSRLWNGAVAAALYRSDILLDDIQVTRIDAPSGAPEDPDPRPEPGGTYYVSPSGSDSNPGTEEQPWKSMARAAELAQRGDTVIFEDGLYIETRPVSFMEGGTEDERIVFKARNKHQAVIEFRNLPTTKILMLGTPYITLQDFEITQNNKGTTTADIFIQARQGSHHVHVIGNKIHNAFEEGVKGYLVTDFLIEGNTIYDMNHEGIDFVHVDSSIIRNNEISEVGRVGVLAKGGSIDIQIYNNYIHNESAYMNTGAIYIGGATDHISTRDPSVNGYEAWNMVVYNNVIVGKPLNGTATINNGIGFGGSKDSAAYNNIVIGTRNGIYLYNPTNSSERVGWDWDPDNVNPVFMNNIIMNSVSNAVVQAGSKPPINLIHDHNLYYNNGGMPGAQEPNGVYADPLFEDINEANWRLQEGSPALGAGAAVPEFVLFDGQTTIDISADYDGVPRGDVWDIGIYQHESEVPEEPEWVRVEDIQQTIVSFQNAGDFSSEQAVQALQLHLTAIGHFEKQGATAKVIDHMGGFKLLLDHQKENDLISEQAYQVLKAGADALIESLS